MKTLSYLTLAILFVACGSQNSSQSNANEAETTIVSDFLANIKSLKSVEDANPIVAFKEAAENEADATYSLTKKNIADIIETGQGFSKCVVTAGEHTIVLITDFNECQESGSWATCMPMGKGFVKRGDLDYEEDYLNNIIGTPDNQERTVYFFN